MKIIYLLGILFNIYLINCDTSQTKNNENIKTTSDTTESKSSEAKHVVYNNHNVINNNITSGVVSTVTDVPQETKRKNFFITGLQWFYSCQHEMLKTVFGIRGLRGVYVSGHDFIFKLGYLRSNVVDFAIIFGFGRGMRQCVVNYRYHPRNDVSFGSGYFEMQLGKTFNKFFVRASTFGLGSADIGFSGIGIVAGRYLTDNMYLSVSYHSVNYQAVKYYITSVNRYNQIGFAIDYRI